MSAKAGGVRFPLRLPAPLQALGRAAFPGLTAVPFLAYAGMWWVDPASYLIG